MIPLLYVAYLISVHFHVSLFGGVNDKEHVVMSKPKDEEMLEFENVQKKAHKER